MCYTGKHFTFHNFIQHDNAQRTYSTIQLLDHPHVTSSGGLSQDFAGSGQNRVTAKNRVRSGSSHRAVRNITVAKFNK